MQDRLLYFLYFPSKNRSHVFFDMEWSFLWIFVTRFQYSFFWQVNWKLLKSSGASESTIVRNNITPSSVSTHCLQTEKQCLNLFHSRSLLLESFGSTVELSTALFVELSVVHFSCSSICCSEMSCSEEKHNKTPFSIIGCFLTDLHCLTLKTACW